MLLHLLMQLGDAMLAQTSTNMVAKSCRRCSRAAIPATLICVMWLYAAQPHGSANQPFFGVYIQPLQCESASSSLCYVSLICRIHRAYHTAVTNKKINTCLPFSFLLTDLRISFFIKFTFTRHLALAGQVKSLMCGHPVISDLYFYIHEQELMETSNLPSAKSNCPNAWQ